MINELPPELEWKYLVNETMVGERCIVPLLQQVIRNPVVKLGMREDVLRQLDEEVAHVRLYHQLIGKEGLQGSGYDRLLSSYVRTLPKVALQLYALQGMLEGIALGALQHRIDNWDTSPSYTTDKKAYQEELDHVAFSYPHFQDLIVEEGLVSEGEFKQVSKDVNAMFTATFTGTGISRFLLENFGISSLPEQIDRSDGVTELRKRGAKILARTKREFERTYRQAALTS
jgi:hypothetical protein